MSASVPAELAAAGALDASREPSPPVGIALGTMQLGTRVPADRAYDILDAYLDLGGQWLDTANCYAFWLSDTGLGGQSETVIGDWLARRGARDKVLLSTKVGAEPTRPGGFPAHAEGLAPEVVRDRLRSSLQRLRTDRVDLYWAHMEDRSRPVPEVADTFADLVAQGLTSRIGLSNHPTWFAAAAKVHAESKGAAAFTALQLRESYLHHRPDVEVEGENHPHGMMTIGSKDFAARNGVDLWAYTPLLTGLYEHPDRPLPTAYDHPGTYARLEALRTWSRELGVRPSQLVIALLIAQEPSIRPIVGVSSVAQVRDAVEAARLSLPEEALTALNTAG
ncbi:aldo/keto reductase [Actinomyces sp. 2119]|uniref:aldo/keto reductase n=1 Tax=Actinomyces sp. 2119 TaxID=2321393 RepID=UPI000E6C78D0|nr:aldo/keto reductase [Actinomyces sp. 2119]RJF44715.1 aldo/keto reductase [Actinomyces sp. 2119]